MKTLTDAAQAAQAIRKELKAAFPLTTFNVRSKTYSGGDSVYVSWMDGPTTEAVETVTNKYQMGSFDGMQDLYEFTNCRDDIPQVKYVMTGRGISRERKIEAVNYLNMKYDCAATVDDYDYITGNFIEELHEWPSTIVHRMFSGAYRGTQLDRA